MKTFPGLLSHRDPRCSKSKKCHLSLWRKAHAGSKLPQVLKNCRGEFFAVDKDLRTHSLAGRAEWGLSCGRLRASEMLLNRAAEASSIRIRNWASEWTTQAWTTQALACPDCVGAQRLPRQNRCLYGTHGLHGEGDRTPTLMSQTHKNKARKDLSQSHLCLWGHSQWATAGQLFTPSKDHSPHQNGFIFTLKGISLSRWMATMYHMEFKVKTTFSSPST